jgi:hypothetical protein
MRRFALKTFPRAAHPEVLAEVSVAVVVGSEGVVEPGHELVLEIAAADAGP